MMKLWGVKRTIKIFYKTAPDKSVDNRAVKFNHFLRPVDFRLTEYAMATACF